MIIWVLVAVLALLIPILAILLDSQVGQALADRISGEGDDDRRQERLDALEGEVRYLAQRVEELREETEFVRSLVEGRDGEERHLDAGD
jgi:hypothetical protein